MKVDDRVMAKIEAGVTMLKWAKEGKDELFMWNELGKQGFDEKERIEIAQTVSNFMKHKNGNHESCPPMCNAVNDLAKEFPDREPSVQECADAIERRHELHDGKQYSQENLEEWK